MIDVWKPLSAASTAVCPTYESNEIPTQYTSLIFKSFSVLYRPVSSCLDPKAEMASTFDLIPLEIIISDGFVIKFL